MIQLKEQKRILMDDVDIDWEFTERETHAFRTLWNKQENLETIAERLKRPVLEIGLLIKSGVAFYSFEIFNVS